MHEELKIRIDALMHVCGVIKDHLACGPEGQPTLRLRWWGGMANSGDYYASAVNHTRGAGILV